jgi:ABC-type antimicrobial peptide transport system permease subunit
MNTLVIALGAIILGFALGRLWNLQAIRDFLNDTERAPRVLTNVAMIIMAIGVVVAVLAVMFLK